MKEPLSPFDGRRRLTKAQAIACENARPGTRTRCRCKGSCRGLRRVGLNPTRWDFAALPKSDPHYIPPPYRRVSPRKAVLMLKGAMDNIRVVNQAAWDARKLLLLACSKAAVVMRSRWMHSAHRKIKAQRMNGEWSPVPTAAVWRNRRIPLRLKPATHPVDLLNSAIAFLSGRGKSPPVLNPADRKWEPSPPGIAQLAIAQLLDARAQLERESPVHQLNFAGWAASFPSVPEVA